MNELYLIDLSFLFQKLKVVKKLLHHLEQLVLTSSILLVPTVNRVNTRDHQVNITALNGQFCRHTPKYLYANKPIAVPVGESVLNYALNDGDESLSLFSNRVLEQIDLFYFALHLLLQLVEEQIVALRVDLLARLTLFHDHHVSFLLLALLKLLNLLLLLHQHLLVELGKQVLNLLVKRNLRDLFLVVIIDFQASQRIDPTGCLLLLFNFFVFVRTYFFGFLLLGLLRVLSSELL